MSPRARAPWPITERELGLALDLLDAMHRHARDCLAEQGRDPAVARVLTTSWRDALGRYGIGRGRFLQLLPALERRELVRLDGPFAEVVDPRRGRALVGAAA
jgi:hypothetical protein